MHSHTRIQSMTEELEGCIFTSEKNKEFIGLKRTKKDWFDVVFLSIRIAVYGFFLRLIGLTLLFNDDYSLKKFYGGHLFGIPLILGIAFAIFVMAANAIGLLLASRKRLITIDYSTNEIMVKTGLFKKKSADFSEIRYLEYALYNWRDNTYGARNSRQAYRVELQLVFYNRTKLPLLTLNNEFIIDKGDRTIQRKLLKRAKPISERIASSLRVPIVLEKMIRE